MPPMFVGTSQDGGGSSSITLDAPAGTQPGDFHFVIIGIGTSSESVDSWPSGWTLIEGAGDPGGGDSYSTWVLVSDTDDGDATFGKTGGRGYSAVRVTYRDHAGWGAHTLATVNPTSTHPITPVDTTEPDSLVIAGIHSGGTDLSFTPPSGWTERIDVNLGNENDVLAVADVEVPSPGQVSGSFSSSSSEATQTVAVVLNGVVTGQAITVGTVATSEVVPGPAVAAGPVVITAGTVDSQAAILGPSLAVGPVTITAGSVGSQAVVRGPSLLVERIVEPGTVPSSEQVHGPTLRPSLTVTAGTVTTEEKVHRPVVQQAMLQPMRDFTVVAVGEPTRLDTWLADEPDNPWAATEPDNAWVATEPETIRQWASVLLDARWATAAPESHWAVRAPGSHWSFTAPQSRWKTTEPTRESP